MALSNTVVFQVKRGEPELIVPDKPTPNEIKPLSDIDDQDGLRFLVPMIFFYPGKSSHDPVHVIRKGLGEALVFYYPFAGRIFEGADRKLMVNCNSEGVVFVEANANIKIEQLGDGIFPPCPYMDEFLCTAPDSGGIIGCPLLFFQVTRFICGGFALGIRLNHTMADGYGLMLFLNTIAELTKGRCSTPSTPPVWERQLLNARSPPRITRTHYEFDDFTSTTKSKAIPEDKLVRTSVLFGPREIQSLRNQAQKYPSCTRYELIVACLWKCRTIALEIDHNDTVRFSGLVNVRNEKLGMNFPIGYYGNAFVYPAAISKAGTLTSSPLSYALDLVQRAKKRVDEEYVRSTADLMVIKGRPKYGTPLNFIVSDIRSLGFDKLDLGWGKPLYGGVPWAISDISFSNNIDQGEDDGVVVVSICLPPLALDKFRFELTNYLY
ncbi:hypothetical protein ACJIZ3_004272 [Penstemon smallii]|uniref:Uncharacterized protein n=1 Tax=Penstemon smallii TaxID=265156 RepID=A0ABD3S1N7_9LAMI